MRTLPTISPFEASTGSNRLARPVAILALLLGAMFVGLLTIKMGVTAVGVVLGLGAALVYFYFVFNYPVVGLYTAVGLAFILIGLGRYVRDLQVGLGMDAILILTYLALFINRFHKKVDLSPANKDITVLAVIWFGYSVFEIVNPEARSFAAWFSGRGISFYMFMMVPLTLLFINNYRKLDMFLYVWGAFSILASLKGVMQLQVGLDSAEQAWLNDGNFKTHILFGRLRVFSFLSDAGQFGANQAYSAVVASIYAGSMTQRKSKIFFAIVAALGFYGMMISGTRGAISVPLVGLMTFFVLRKNIKVLAIGAGFLALVFVFFKFTMIGQGNPTIRRMRTAFDPNDASLQVRLDNQRLLKGYLASRPFGGGIGHGGVKAQKYLPNAFLSQIATDSWYVLIWVEQGIVGLLLHLFILFYTLIKASLAIMFRVKDPRLRLKLGALTAGMAGVMMASYGNAVLGAMPTGMLMYISMAVILNSKQLEANEQSSLNTPKAN